MKNEKGIAAEGILLVLGLGIIAGVAVSWIDKNYIRDEPQVEPRKMEIIVPFREYKVPV